VVLANRRKEGCQRRSGAMIHSQSEKIVPMCLPKQNETLKRFGTTQKAREKSKMQPDKLKLDARPASGCSCCY